MRNASATKPDWAASRLIEIWNSLPGVSPVKKFTDRATAVSRIWKGLQSLGHIEATEVVPAIDVAEPAVTTAVAPDAAPAAIEVVEQPTAPPAIVVHESPTAESATPSAPQTPDVAPAAAPATNRATRPRKPPTTATNANGPRETSKTAIVLALLKREGGATLSELMSPTGRQKHSVRGFLSGTIGKKMGLTLVSVKAEDGQRTYSLAR